MNEHNEQQVNLSDEWLRYAQNDLIVAKHSFEDLNPKQTEIASYHCQQCAEKALKAFLLFKNTEPPKIHDLKVLCKMCQDIDTSFSDIQIHCAHLNPYGIAVRYPNELSPNEEMVKIALIKANAVYDFCFNRTRIITSED